MAGGHPHRHSRTGIHKKIPRSVKVKTMKNLGRKITAKKGVETKMKQHKLDKDGKKNAPNRLYVKGTVLGYRRSKVNQTPGIALVKLQNVETKEEGQWYIGKKVAYVYRAKTEKNGSKFRAIWGKVRATHGCSGVVRCKFAHNLPTTSFGKRVRVMLIPSKM